MKFSTEDKNEIRDALKAYCGNYSSNNRAAESLQGVSPAIVSQIINSKYDSISDDMFVKISRQIGFSFEHWNICDSRCFQEANLVMNDAQTFKNVTWIVGDAGCGKTTAAIEYRRTHKNVYYILCSEDMRRSDFVREIARQVGAPCDSVNIREILENAIDMISYLNNPLIIFDEGDKLTDSVFNYFITIYNRLENHSGIIFLSTDYIKRRINNGIRYNKKGYKEINSRIGRRFFDLSATDQTDIYAICKANELEDARKSENDLRRVRRTVHSTKRQIESRQKQ